MDETFKLVYAGGHHEVWCNGQMHEKKYESGRFGKPFKCDCSYWQDPNKVFPPPHWNVKWIKNG